MNVIIYKSLFHNTDLWTPNGNITDILLRSSIPVGSEHLYLQTILFSYILFHLHKPHCVFDRDKKSKVTLFHSIIWDHLFLNHAQKEQFLDFFCKMQRMYYGFSRFLRLYKYKKASITVSTDLFLNSLDPKHKRTWILYLYKSIYYFEISDVWQVLEKAWTTHSNYELDLYMPKNPYTNIPFTKTELYYYYFHRKHGGFSIPTLLEYMFLKEFDLTSFEITYESCILTHIIKKMVLTKTGFSNELYLNVIEMIEENPYTNLWNIHPDFPKERLVDIMRPYVYIYYLTLYGKLTENQFIYLSSFLHTNLYLFWKFNPKFGNKKHIITSSKLFRNHNPVIFFDKHLPIPRHSF